MKNAIQNYADSKPLNVNKYSQYEKEYHKKFRPNMDFKEWEKLVTCGSGSFSCSEMSTLHEYISTRERQGR